jgi:excisionase family DNA binding protein
MTRSTTTSLPKLHTVDESAEILRVSSRTVRRLMATEKLPVHRIGRSVRISETDLRNYLMSTK